MANVTDADIITGSYDLIALAEAEDMVALVDLVTAHVQGIWRRRTHNHLRGDLVDQHH